MINILVTAHYIVGQHYLGERLLCRNDFGNNRLYYEKTFGAIGHFSY